jgi:hypothetical protein
MTKIAGEEAGGYRATVAVAVADSDGLGLGAGARVVKRSTGVTGEQRPASLQARIRHS